MRHLHFFGGLTEEFNNLTGRKRLKQKQEMEQPLEGYSFSAREKERKE
jgi:hypothetical protein